MSVPKLRFKEFNEEWKTVKLSDVTTRIGDGIHSTPKYDENGSIYFANGSNIKNGTLVFDESTKKINNEEFSRYIIGLNENSILVSLNGATWGRFGIYQGEVILPGKSLGYINIDLKVSKWFMYYQIQLKKIRRFFESEITGSTIKNLSLQTLRNTEVTITIPSEQEKIADFFRGIDQKIQLQQQKIDLLQEQKKGYMQKIFKQELRFKGFSDTWQQKRLAEVANFHDNLRVPITSSDRIKGETPYYGANGIQDYVEGFTHDGEFVLIAEDGANDLINYPVNYVKGKVWVNNHAHVVSGKINELDVLFLSSRIKSMNIYPWLVGGGRAKLNGEVLKKIPIFLPSYEEQQKIGAFFETYDRKIQLQQQMLDLLQEQKKGFMQQMFI